MKQNISKPLIILILLEICYLIFIIQVNAVERTPSMSELNEILLGQVLETTASCLS